MTWQDPGGNPAPGGPGGPDDDATRADWNLAELDAMVGNGGGGAASNAGQPADPGSALPPPPVTGAPPVTPLGPPAGPPPAPPQTSAPPAWSATDPGAAPPLNPGYGGGPGASYGAVPGPGYAPPTGAGMAWAPPPTARAGMAYGGTFERVIAYWVDGFVMLLVGLVIYIPATIAGFGPFANIDTIFERSYRAGYGSTDLSVVVPDAGSLAVLFVFALISAAISAAYFVFQWSGSSRATIGMRILHLEIGNAADGRTITRGQAFKRWLAMGGWMGLLSAIPFLSSLVSLALLAWELVLLITTASSPTKQGLHDRFAETAIVAPSGSSGNGVVVGCALIIGVLIVMFVLSFVALAFLGGQVSTILSTVGESV